MNCVYHRAGTERRISERKFLLLIYGLVSAILFSSCTEKIDIPLQDSFVRLVVDGAITTDTLPHTIKLPTTTSYYLNQPATAVSGAEVSISDGTVTYPLAEKAPGIYQTSAGVYGIPGHNYTLTVKLAEAIGGHTEYSASDQMGLIYPLDSIGLLMHPDWGRFGVWEVKCYVQDPPTVDYYRFMLYRNNTLITDSLNKWFAVDDKLFNGNYTNGATVAYLNQGNPQEGLRTGDTIWLETDKISKEYCNFIWQVQEAVRGANPLFSGPPANVKGNISNGGVGFFAAYNPTRSFTITPNFPGKSKKTMNKTKPFRNWAE